MVSILSLALVFIAAATPMTEPLDEAGALWARCAKADPDACYRLSALRTVRIADPAVRAAKTANYEAACAQKDPAACFALGMILDDDGGLPVDGKRAFEVFGRACDAGFAPACVRVSIFYRVSVPASEPDAPQRASALLRRACDAGLPEACHDLARAGVVGGAVPVDDATAATLLERGCALGSFNACLRMAEALLPEPPFACDQCQPDAVARGDDRCIDCELAVCRKEHCCATCDGRRSYACCGEEFDVPLPYPLTTPVQDPKQVARARAQAVALLAPAVRRLTALCDGGFTPACRDLAELFGAPRLPYFDETKAASLRARSAP